MLILDKLEKIDPTIGDLKKVTNFERMISSKKVRNYFRIKFNKETKDVEFDNDKTQELIKLVKEAETIKVKEIYGVKEVNEKVAQILGKDTLPQIDNATGQVNSAIIKNIPQIKKSQVKFSLLVSNLSAITKHPHFYSFSLFLTKLNYKKELLIAAPLYRILLDYSIRFYCDEYKISTKYTEDGKTKNKELFKIMLHSIPHMKTTGLQNAMADRCLEELKKQGSTYITYLNAATHNYDFNITFEMLENIKKVFDPVIQHAIENKSGNAR